MSGRSPGADRRAAWRGRKAIAAAIVALSLVAMGSVDAQTASPALPYRDLAEANAQLAEVREGVAEALAALDAARAELDARRTLRDDVADEELVLATAIQAHEQHARELAVEAYMTGRGLSDAAYLLDADTANEWAYRSGVLSESVDAVAESSRSYVELAADASDRALALAAEIDDAARKVEALRDEVAHLRILEARAEYVVAIAEINAQADTARDHHGRAEPTAEQWQALRRCESTGNYQVASGNGFWGAYQFTLETWGTVGGVGYPSEAAPEEQDARARLLYHRRGAQPWPICGRFLPQD